MKKLTFLFIVLASSMLCYAQNPQWMIFTNGYQINAIAEEGNTMWVCTGSGLLSIDKTPGDLTFYNPTNSGLPYNYVSSIAIDGSGNKWIGTYRGLAKFDGTNWTVYNTDNSGLPGNDVYSIAMDGNGTKWIGTRYGGLAKFDGTNWTVYNTTNSGLPNNIINSIAIDRNDTKWIATWGGGMAKFNGTNWTVYNTTNSDLPNNNIYSIAIDGSGNKWIGTWGGGIAKFDGTNWTVYNMSNSGLANNYVWSITIDESGTKWIGTSGGLAAFNENGIPSDVKENILSNYNVSVFPNPASDYLKIEQSEAYISLIEIINLQGQVIKSQRILGNQSTLDLTTVSAGVYILKIYTNSGFVVKKLIKK